jgi:hypothetical protein
MTRNQKQQRVADAEANAVLQLGDGAYAALGILPSLTCTFGRSRRAVEEADGLVASAMKRLAEVFAEERSKLEQQWDRGDNVSTEDLRIALQRYRSFFHQLLSV